MYWKTIIQDSHLTVRYQMAIMFSSKTMVNFYPHVYEISAFHYLI